MKSTESPDPRRCADIRYFSMWGGGVDYRCGFFWYDCGPKDESGEIPGEYVEIICMKDDRKLTMGIIDHTARRGCCCWKPCFEDIDAEENKL
jgi:hypothetical protein